MDIWCLGVVRMVLLKLQSCAVGMRLAGALTEGRSGTHRVHSGRPTGSGGPISLMGFQLPWLLLAQQGSPVTVASRSTHSGCPYPSGTPLDARSGEDG